MPYFAAQGYDCYALILRRHGGSDGHRQINHYTAADYHTAADYLADLRAAIATLPADPILIGHSLGGYLVQRYLEQHNAPAAILLAPLPISATLGFFLRYAAQHPLITLRALATGDGRQVVA